MSAAVGVELEAGPLERVRADLLVVTYFADERPLRGAAGRADWRLCGLLSDLLRRGGLSGRWGEATLVPASGGLRAPLLLALGLGPRGDFDLLARERAAADAVRRVLDLGRQHVALALRESQPGAASAGLRPDAEALVTGVAQAVVERDAEIHLRLLVPEAALAELHEAFLHVRPRGLRRPLALRLPSRGPTPARRPPPAPAASLPGQVK